MALSSMLRMMVGFSWMRLMEHRVTEEEVSQQFGQVSNVRIPPHWPNEVTLRRSQVLIDVSLIGHSIEIQLEVSFMFTGPSEILEGSVTTPEKVFPIMMKRKVVSMEFVTIHMHTPHT
jgi:hypothetical protein